MSEILGDKSVNEPAAGKTAGVSAVVTEQNTASAVASGCLDVFSTPMMIALMERAACAALEDSLAEGQTSVGTFISVKHIAASPIGALITATATISEVSGREIKFTVSANDGIDEIGQGVHTRFIVDKEKFMKKAEAKKGV